MCPSSQPELFTMPAPLPGQAALEMPDPPTSADERLRRMLAGAERARAQRVRDAYTTALEETGRIWETCRCDLGGRTAESLHELGAGCTAPRWVCPRLDAMRRRLGA